MYSHRLLFIHHIFVWVIFLSDFNHIVELLLRHIVELQLLDIIKQLPNRFNLFTEKGYGIYVLDNYSVHLRPKVRQALLKKGYVLVIIGGGITGDIKINDTSCHHNLEKHYREFEMN